MQGQASPMDMLLRYCTNETTQEPAAAAGGHVPFDPRRQGVVKTNRRTALAVSSEAAFAALEASSRKRGAPASPTILRCDL